MIGATNYAAIIRPVQILVMVVVVLFFARVMRVALLESRPLESDRAPRERGRRRGSRWALEIVEPPALEGERYEVESQVVVGRAHECDVSLLDNFLSSRHARFVADGGDLAVEDLGSTNGTYVNQELITGRATLHRGDKVQVGGVLFEVVR
ncbi:MAG: FHA domain-containing protein [Acidobacteria bacterium]|nr:FHA domain-containing protein [Acidobacteriota bacterium]